jgi:hypothetical protein
MARNARAVFVGAVLAALAAGCKAPPPPIVAVEGVVRLDGQPLNKAAVRFIPQIDCGPEYIAVGVTDESGRFTLTCKGQPGACACINQVLVLETELPPGYRSDKGHAELAHYFQSLGGRPLPAKYGNLVDSPLTADVKAGQKNYDFDLTR